jgi:hypothetical protein
VSQAIQTLSHSGFSELFKPFSWPLWMPLPSVRKVRHAKLERLKNPDAMDWRVEVAS